MLRAIADRLGLKINFVGTDLADLAKLRERAELAAHWLSYGQWTDGWDPHAGDDKQGSAIGKSQEERH